MFDNNSETLIHWFENLEETCQNLIFDKSESWFQNSLDKNDVETAFNSVIRIYKSGKYYLVRTNIKTNATSDPAVKIYSENEIPLTINDVKEDTNIISILEIQGIKFTTRNFQIDIELRQVMVLDNEPLFDNCLIKTNYSNKSFASNQIQKQSVDLINDNKKECESLEKAVLSQIDFDNNDNDNNESLVSNVGVDLGIELDLGKEVEANTVNPEENENEEQKCQEHDNHSVFFDIQELPMEELEDKTELKEMNLKDDLENFDNETITLKKPNEVYYELYKEAREKAKMAKKGAIVAYLEAKNIKKLYMLDNLDESESDIDAEIDEVSESELEGL
jgi:hypothetical protein